MNTRKAKLAKLGSDHPDTLHIMHNLAFTYWNQGRWDDAEILQVEVMNARKAKLGSGHPDTLHIMHWHLHTGIKRGGVKRYCRWR